MERDDSAAPLSIIEEGDEHDLGAEAFADMAMGGMDMSLELNSLQIRAFLARNEAQSENSGAFTSQHPTMSAYEAMRNGTVHYSRREDKVRALQEHPVVASVVADGRTVGCKCGRNVRLNPPWYILKFEQHVASRNCSFLRQSRPSSKKRKRAEMEATATAAAASGGSESGDAQQAGSQVEGAEEEDVDESGEYCLQSVDAVLRREFGVVQDGRRVVVPPTADAPDDRVRMYKGAMTLRENDHFTRITPDGRFAECKCSRIVLLGGPWQPGQFLMHVADKQKPKKRAKTASASTSKRGSPSGMSPSPTARTMISAGVLMRPPTSASALLQAHKAKKSFPREIRWDVARARGLLPCPGLRDERMNTFVTSAVQLTGGARQRQKIARELFPHLFPDTSEYDQTAEEGKESDMEHRSTQSISKKRQPKLQQQLLEAEKMLLHDVIEGEALWFVDKDGNSVRSLDCLGIIDSGKGEVRCPSCTALRTNAALRTAAATKYKMANRPGPPRNPINRKFCSGRVCSLLEAEFDMREPYARVLRDLALADIPSALNTWMEMASMSLSGDFDSHPALLGLTEAMVRLKDKEQRGVGLQNMTYSDLLDTFMRSLADLSPEACELFQKHLGGRKQRQLLAATSRSLLPTKRKLLPPTGNNTPRVVQDQQSSDPLYGVSTPATAGRITSEEGFVHLLDPSVVGLGMPNLSIGDIQDVDLSSFPTSAGIQSHQNSSAVMPSASSLETESTLTADSYQLPVPRKESDNHDDTSTTDAITGVAGSEVTVAAGGEHDHDGEVDESKDAEADVQMESDPAAVAFLSELAPPEDNDASKADDVVMPSDHVPCTGLRDENVQAYVANAVQIVGGSRPRYVIARELFPRVFGNDKKVRIVEKLDDEQRLVLQDAVFSECLWRVDKEGRCVRSLRCKRFVPVSDNDDRANPQYQGVCRACRDLRTVPNFRSVLSRSKVPKKLDNIKYVPSVYTESDPFLRKLSKNAAFRGLYQTVKRLASSAPGDNSEAGAERLKRVYFWLRFARMGVFGHFKSHPVFEGLMKSMVEIKDKERRGVGKQNMQYSRALDEFMQSMAQISTEAFELFAAQFCGRTLRSQKVKRRPVFTAPMQPAVEGTAAEENTSTVAPSTHEPLPPPAALQAHQHQHYLMPPDDLLSGRSLSSEESQRFMDRMMAEVNREMALAAGRRPEDINADSAGHEQPATDEDDSNRVGPETYLNDEGVLTTEI
ncbi:hypothetical protein PHYSODRAFT_556960 [Phytophthora sojae]|uniref:Uncharacterized protein n=1 Tax=Phytophthora sojae (strain P6497) TaxID=1094619 RepID=G4YV72_PHYSP|nr:hypothetical protein PHYSODRAFT_556960 [Phytophthora sojae]EGZ24371.1 hypothetical protein PHYSODRAFT_556960 [Phytophthora sojae]|eukprot:XP_009519659.1 hypothetical protein PHYSODRAFT_556960 [Phytophthora sojae]